MIIIDMSYRVESCKIWFVCLFMMPGGLFWWSADLCFDHMFFVLIDDGKVYGGDWWWSLRPLQSFNRQSSSMCMGRISQVEGEMQFRFAIRRLQLYLLVFSSKNQKLLCIFIFIKSSMGSNSYCIIFMKT